MKHRTSSLKNAYEIMQKGGAIASGDWTGGSGNFVHKRPIPTACIEVKIGDIAKLKEPAQSWARAITEARPRVQKVIVVSDVGAVQEYAEKQLVAAGWPE